jgi:hypothetical protein
MLENAPTLNTNGILTAYYLIVLWSKSSFGGSKEEYESFKHAFQFQQLAEAN